MRDREVSAWLNVTLQIPAVAGVGPGLNLGAVELNPGLS